MKSRVEKRKHEREYYWKTRNRRLELNKKRYEANPEAFHKRNKKFVLKKKYGLTLEQYQQMFENQNGKCAICQEEEKGRLLPVDHDHSNGKVRGLLCGNCNRGLGLFKDNKDLLQKAANYLAVNGG